MKRIISVKVHRETDTDPDLSYLGEYTSRPGAEDVTIDRQARGDMERGTYRYFVAAMSGKESGNLDSPEQDYQRMEAYNRNEWCMMGVWAEAEVVLTDVVQRIRSGGLWGIESDSGEEYFKEEESNQLHDLGKELEAIGFTPREIADAFTKAKKAG